MKRTAKIAIAIAFIGLHVMIANTAFRGDLVKMSQGLLGFAVIYAALYGLYRLIRFGIKKVANKVGQDNN